MENRPTILVVEDEGAVRTLISTALEAHDYRCLVASNGQKALLMASSYKVDVVILDLGLPDIDGIDIIKKIRSWSHMPIIVVSARQEDHDKIDALDAGADDYLTKPFSVEEFLARLRVTMRRLQYTNNNENKEFINGDLKVDYTSGCAYIQEQELHLTPIEYKLLCLLCQNVGKVLTHQYLTKEIWGTSWDNDVASLRVFMATLRKKLEKNSKYSYVQTHVGVGYRMLKVK